MTPAIPVPDMELKALRRHVRALEDECENLRVAVEDADERVDALASRANKDNESILALEAENARVRKVVAEVARQQALVKELRAELRARESERKAIADARDEAFEELQSTNQELETANEELQSTNEELQSTNEELETTNDGLRQLSRAIEISPTSVLITDAQGTIVYVNPSFERASGFTAEEAVGESPRILKSGLVSQRTYEDLWSTISSGRIWRGEICNRRKAGDLYWEFVAIAPLADPSGTITHYVGIQQETTDQKKMVQQLQDLRENLFRVSRLSELGQTVSALTHELNQPLAAIMNYVQAARRQIDGGSADALRDAGYSVEKAAEQVQRAGAIIEGLRAIAEKRRPQRSREDINDIVAEANTLALAGLEDQKLRIELNPGKRLPRMYVDRTQIQQVVFNLVRNAVEAMANSSRRTLKVETFRASPSAVSVSVCDTGCGLPEGDVDRIFEPFVSMRRDGMGMGLSISRSIVETQGGQLTASDNEDGGATFTFTLPVETRTTGRSDERR